MTSNEPPQEMSKRDWTWAELYVALAERDQRIADALALMNVALDQRDKANERIATREETEFIVGKLAQAEQERDAIQETLAAVEHEVAIVYCHITGSRISKCNTLASVVISEADDFVQKDIDEAVKEAAERAEARVAALVKRLDLTADAPVDAEYLDCCYLARADLRLELMAALQRKPGGALAEPKEGA